MVTFAALVSAILFLVQLVLTSCHQGGSDACTMEPAAARSTALASSLLQTKHSKQARAESQDSDASDRQYDWSMIEAPALLDNTSFLFWGHRVWMEQIDASLLAEGHHGTQQKKRADFMLTPPSDEPYDLQQPDKQSYAQYGQDLLLLPILKMLGKDGFFVEAGGGDGESASNTLLYEKLGWKGLLVEPNPDFAKRLEAKHRKCYFFKGCLSPTSHEEKLHFKMEDWNGHVDTSSSDTVLAEPLQDILQKIGQKTVDFWSLDVEGGEAMLLNATDFSKVEVGLLLIEMNKNNENNAGIEEVMHNQGFIDIGHSNYWLDHIFVNPKYFTARGLVVPTEKDLPQANRNSAQ